MKIIISLCFAHFLFVLASAQIKILPGDNSLNKTLIKQGKFTMGYYVVKDGTSTESCIYETDVRVNNQKAHLNTTLNFIN